MERMNVWMCSVDDTSNTSSYQFVILHDKFNLLNINIINIENIHNTPISTAARI